MENVCQRISNEDRISSVQKDMMTLYRVFELFRYDEFEAASRRYSPVFLDPLEADPCRTIHPGRGSWSFVRKPPVDAARGPSS
jgi:hypothetical protein